MPWVSRRPHDGRGIDRCNITSAKREKLKPHIIKIHASPRGKYTTTQWVPGEMRKFEVTMLHTGSSKNLSPNTRFETACQNSKTMTKTTCKKEIIWMKNDHTMQIHVQPHNSMCRVSDQECDQRMLQMNSNETYRSEKNPSATHPASV